MPAATETTPATITDEEDNEPILVRVRRRPDAEPLTAIELSFDGTELKRRRFVTESSSLTTALTAQLASLNVTNNDSNTEENKTEQASYTLGVGNEEAGKAKERNVTLRRLMPDTQGKSIDEIKRQH